jgi:nicotinate-nucleotide adenylyltransferase
MRMDDHAPERLRRVGVMGGTFDPIHVGHLVIASEALYEFRLERVTFMPTGQPWQKRSYSDREDRYLMTVLGTSGNPRFTVSRMELDRTGPTYTADTMRELKSFHGPDAELFFILGADAVLKLGTWERIDNLREQASVIAVTRPGFDLDNFKREKTWPEILVLASPPVDISSTQIRTRVREGRPIDYLVPADVVTYIKEQGLYVGGEEIQDAAG